MLFAADFQTTPHGHSEYDICERLASCLTNYTIRSMIAMEWFSGTGKFLKKIAYKSQLCHIISDQFLLCYRSMENRTNPDDVTMCNSAYYQNHNSCQDTPNPFVSKRISAEVLLNSVEYDKCLPVLSCPPIVINLAYHGADHFRDMAKLPKMTTMCENLNYALRITDTSKVYCNEENILFLIKWLSHMSHVKLLEILQWNWRCSDKGNRKLFEYLFHSKLYFIRIVGVDEIRIFDTMSDQLPNMQNLNFIQFEDCNGCLFNVTLPESIRGLRLKGFQFHLTELPPKLEYIALKGSLSDDFTWNVPTNLAYMDFKATLHKNTEVNLIFPSVAHLETLTLVLHGVNEHTKYSNWMEKKFPKLRTLRIELYDKNGVGMFDQIDLQALWEAILQGSFPELTNLSLRNAQLTASMETVIKIASKCALSDLDLSGVRFSEDDGVKLLRYFQRGMLRKLSDRADWKFENNPGLEHVAGDLVDAAKKSGIDLTGIRHRDGFIHVSSMYKDEDL